MKLRSRRENRTELLERRLVGRPEGRKHFEAGQPFEAVGGSGSSGPSVDPRWLRGQNRGRATGRKGSAATGRRRTTGCKEAQQRVKEEQQDVKEAQQDQPQANKDKDKAKDNEPKDKPDGGLPDKDKPGSGLPDKDSP